MRFPMKSSLLGEKFKASDGKSPMRALEAGQQRNFP